MILLEILGWIGSILYIVSYFLLSFNYIKKGDFYYILNTIAAFLVIIISFYKNTFQSILINAIWLYISFLGYTNKEISFKILNKKAMYIISIIFVSIFIFIFMLGKHSLSFEVLAWYSVFAFSGSYLLYSLEKIKEKAFHFFNFIAAISLIPKMFMFENYQVLVLEILWAIFALNAYIKNTKNNDYLTVCG